MKEFGPAEVYAQRFPRSSHRELRFVWYWLGLLLLVNVPSGIAVLFTDFGREGQFREVAVSQIVVSIACLFGAFRAWRRQHNHDYSSKTQ